MLTAELIAEVYPDCMALDPQEDWDDAIVGICHCYGHEPRIAYDYDAVINKLIKDGLSPDEATEHFNFNIIGSFVGPTTPVFVEGFGDEDEFDASRN